MVTYNPGGWLVSAEAGAVAVWERGGGPTRPQNRICEGESPNCDFSNTFFEKKNIPYVS